jgi:transcriptional regulator with XRE-family HTH domain
MREIDIRKVFGENVKYYRKKIGLSQEELAEKLEISPNHLSVIETGTKFVTYKLLEKLVNTLDIMPSSLFFISGTTKYDDNAENQINLIIKNELEKTTNTIQSKIKDQFFTKS